MNVTKYNLMSARTDVWRLHFTMKIKRTLGLRCMCELKWVSPMNWLKHLERLTSGKTQADNDLTSFSAVLSVLVIVKPPAPDKRWYFFITCLTERVFWSHDPSVGDLSSRCSDSGWPHLLVNTKRLSKRNLCFSASGCGFCNHITMCWVASACFWRLVRHFRVHVHVCLSKTMFKTYESLGGLWFAWTCLQLSSVLIP